MNLDLALMAVVFVFALIGYYTGAIQQLSHWIGIVAAYVLAKPAAAALAPGAAARMGWSEPLTAVALSALLLPVVALGAFLLSRLVINAIVPGEQRNKPDRLAGFALGGAKAAAVGWAALSFTLAFEKPLGDFFASVPAALGKSTAAAYTREHSFFTSVAPTALDRLKALSAMRDDPKLAASLLEDPRLKSLINDPAVRKALDKNGAPAELLQNPQLKKLLEDPELLKKLQDARAL